MTPRSSILRAAGGLLLAYALASGRATAGPTAVATASVTSGPVPLQVHFDASGSSTDHPSGNLVFAWDLDSDGSFDDSTSVSPTWTYGHAGIYTVGLRVRDDGLDFDTTSLIITAGNEAPSPTILSPGPADSWSVGQLVALDGAATDLEQGTLPSSALSWEVTLHECASGPCETTQIATVAGATGSFVAPSAALPAFLEVCLSATDSGFPPGTTAIWPYRRKITIDPTQVSGTVPLLDFPVLIQLVDPDLRSVGFGGRVGTADGHDIVFYSSGTTKLAHEIERYDPSTGSLVAWVRIPVLSDSNPTQLSMHYGNSTVPPQADPEGVWTPHYAAVWHLSDLPTDLGAVLDSTAHGTDGVFHDANGNSDGAAAGKIGGGIELSGDEDYVDLGSPTSLPEGTSARSLCGWARAGVTDSYRWLAAYGSPVPGGAFFLGQGFDGITLQAGGYGASDLLYYPLWDATTWHHVCVTYSGTTARLYADGALRDAHLAPWSLVPGKAYLGRQVSDVEYWSGGLDELRIADVALSSAWIGTEYSNQSSPATFYSVGGQELALTSLPIGEASLTSSVCVELHPAIVDVTLDTDPPGLELVADGETEPAPLLRTVIVGTTVSIDAPSPQSQMGTTYYWSAWSDGGGRAHDVVAPGAPLTLTASFAQIGIASLLEEMTDLARLAETLVPPRKEQLASSYDRASDPPCPSGAPCWFANSDAANYLGDELVDGHTEHVLLDADGPGAVEHMWFATPSGVLRVYIDGAEEPALMAGLQDLLAGNIPPFEAPLAHYAHPGLGGNLYFPLPFAAHCKITWETAAPAVQDYYRIEYRRYLVPISIASFSMEQALAETAKVEEVANVLSGASQAYHPSPQQVHLAGVLSTAGGPLIVSPSVSVGPNAIVRELSLRPQLADEKTLRETLLTISFDGEKTIRAPLGDFFGSGPGLNPYESLPFSVREDGRMRSRWPMPFQREMSIELTREGGPPLLVEYHVYLEPYVWGPETLLFHASWRRDYDIYPHASQDWNYVAIEGRGHYVGDVLNVANPYVTWWGEGDEKIYVDGESFPGQFGTGAEDYYGYSWAMTDLFQHAYHAQTRAAGTPAKNYGRSSVNRWRILDSVPFEEELRFDLEQFLYFPTSDERRPLYDVVTYYYADPGSTNNHPLLTAGELEIPPLPPLVSKPLPGIVLEGEEMSVLATTGQSIPQLTQPWELDGVLWSAHFHMSWVFGHLGDELRLGFAVPSAAEYCVVGYLTRSADYGVFDLKLDGGIVATGVNLGTSSSPSPAEPLHLGVHDLTAGLHEFGATIVGAPNGPAYFGLDALALIPTDSTPQLLLDKGTLFLGPPVATSYDIVAGDLSVLLASGGDFSLAVTSCIASSIPEPSLVYTAKPPVGKGWFFVARGSSCTDGSYDEGGPGQQGSRDAEIAAAPAACP